jgi:DNA-binding response OmpR family regulator
MTKKIVLADDEQYIAIAYNDGLTREGYEVTVAHNGEDALAAIQRVKPDIILLDLIMPKMNGFEVLKAVKEDRDLKDIPVMVLSNLSQATDEKEVLSLGAVDFMVKADYSLAQVIERVASHIGLPDQVSTGHAA